MNVSVKIKNNSIAWSSDLRIRATDTVIYNGNYFSNTTGINSAPPSSDWVYIGSVKATNKGLYKNPANDPDNDFLEEGDVINTVVEGTKIEGIYNGPDPNLLSSYTVYTSIEF